MGSGVLVDPGVTPGAGAAASTGDSPDTGSVAFFLRGAGAFGGSGAGISPSGRAWRFGERMCRAHATSTVDEAVFTSMPARWRRCSTFALGSPSSLATS